MARSPDHTSLRTSARRGLALAAAVAVALVGLPTVATAIYDTPTVLSETGAAEDVETDLAISPDGQYLVYREHNALIVAGTSLWSVRLDDSGAAPVRLDTHTNENVVREFTITPDSSRVVWIEEDASSELTVFSAPIDQPGQQVQLSSSVPADGAVQIGSLQVTPDSSRAVYVGTLAEQDLPEVFSAPVGQAGQQVRVSTTTNPGGGPFASTIEVAPDSSRVAYRGTLASNDATLFSAPLDTTGMQVQVSTSFGPGGAVFQRPVISGDSSSVAYTGDLDVDGRIEVYRAPLTGGTQQALSTTTNASTSVVEFLGSPDGQRVVWVSDPEVDGEFHVHSAAIDQPGSQVQLSSALTGQAFAQVTPDASRVVYTNGIGPSPRTILTAPIDGSGTEVTLDDAWVDSIVSPVAFHLSPDSQRVLYPAEADDGKVALSSVPFDQVTPPVELSFPTAPAPNLFRPLAIAPDSSRVVFGAVTTTDPSLRELHSSPLTQRPLTGDEVSGPLVAGGSVTQAEVTADGDVVVYRADGETDERFEAYATGLGRVPPPPANLTITDLAATSVTLAWDPPPTVTPERWGLRIAPEPVSSGADVTIPDATITYISEEPTYTFDGLAPGTEHTVEVRATNDAGDSDPSRITFVTEGAGPDTEQGVVRRFGDDRFATAVAVSEAAFPDGASTVFVATGADFPDALTGAPLAALHHAPILLVRPGEIPPVTASELERLAPSQIRVLGGQAAVSPEVATQLESIAPVERVAGDDRYATAVAVARQFFEPGQTGITVHLATGRNFPDALSGAAPAGRDREPILLVTEDAIPGPTAELLEEFQPGAVKVLGGAGVISDEVLTEVANLTGITPSRIAGDDRYETSALVAEAFDAVDTVYVATGLTFPDALTAGAIAGATPAAPILLTRPDVVPGAIAAQIERLAPSRIVIVGGPGVVSHAIEPILENLLADDGSPPP